MSRGEGGASLLPRDAERGLSLGVRGEGAYLDRPLACGAARTMDRHGLRRVGGGDEPEGHPWLRGGGRRCDKGRVLLVRALALRPWWLRQLRDLDRTALRNPAAAIVVGVPVGPSVADARRNVDGQRVHRVLLCRRPDMRIHPQQARPDHGHVAPGLVRQRPVVRQIVVQAVRAGVVGRQEARRAIDVVHLPHIGYAGHDVVVRVERVIAEVVPVAKFLVRAGHHLHEPHGSGARGDQLPVQVLLAAGFDPHQGSYPHVRYVESGGSLTYIRSPRVLGRSRRYVVTARMGNIAGSRLGGALMGAVATAGGQRCDQRKVPDDAEYTCSGTAHPVSSVSDIGLPRSRMTMRSAKTNERGYRYRQPLR